MDKRQAAPAVKRPIVSREKFFWARRKTTRNSLGQFLRKREQMFHMSAMLTDHPAALIFHKLHGNLIGYTGPTLAVVKPGRTYRKPKEQTT